MTATHAAATTDTDQPHPVPSSLRVFWAVLRRDLFVTFREFWVFLAQVILQPFFLLFVFGRVLADLGYTQPGYQELLFPGIVALTAVLTALQSTALPLVIDFSFTKEIEDRLLAPLPIWAVGVEKMIFAAIRALIATVVMFPIGWLVLGSIPWSIGALPVVIIVGVLGCLVGAAMGLVLGTFVPPNKINISFALVLTPLLFTGCSQYPWPSLSALPWFQIVTLLNPMTYVSEGLRAALVPDVGHMNITICIVVLVLATAGFAAVGLVGFRRRALD